MNVARLRQPALGALAVLLISGAGVAFAGDPSQSPASPPGVVEPASAADTDTLQQGDQTTPDAAAGQAAESDKVGANAEKSGAEEAGDASLPGGGHADDPGNANADHQFEGVE